VLTNAEEEGAYDSILYRVLDYYFGLPLTDWIAAFESVKDTQVKEAAETKESRRHPGGGLQAFPTAGEICWRLQ
jgi:hypothetical protein